jgi:hypothetical protein|tara:strand:+ start:185 stop:397 length:213 start_codon:yes stop_codon:yes gene_type:complete
MINLYSNIIYKNDIAYKILEAVNIQNFLNSNNTVNTKVLGMYVHEKNGDHVLQVENEFLICETIEEAQIV